MQYNWWFELRRYKGAKGAVQVHIAAGSTMDHYWCARKHLRIIQLNAGGAQLMLASAGALHSIWGFWSDGKDRITAPGIYFFASGLFIFFPGMYLYFDDPVVHGPLSIMMALNVCYFAQVFMHFVSWRPRAQIASSADSYLSPKVGVWGIRWGLGLIVVGASASLGSSAFPGIMNAVAYSGVVILSVSLLRRDAKMSPIGYALIGGAFFIYSEFVFTGFGRLQLGSLGLAIAMAAAPRWRNRAVKGALLGVTVPVLLYLAQSRVAFTASLNPAQSSDTNGLGSVLGPFIRFAELLSMDSKNEITYTYGHSFFATLVALVPRSIWADKPIGFGAKLGHLFRPELDGSGHSELALFFGEWLFAFGLLGLIAMVPVTAYIVGKFDRLMVTVQSLRVLRRRDLLMIVAIVILGSSIADLVWGGSFNYVVRVGPRLLTILGLLVLFAPRGPRSPSLATDDVQRADAGRVRSKPAHLPKTNPEVRVKYPG